MKKIDNMENKFINNGTNEVLKRKGYYLSYCPNTGYDALAKLFNSFGGLMGIESDGRAETALVKNSKFYILNGDFRKQYLKCKSYAECKKFYESKKKKFGSGWSN